MFSVNLEEKRERSNQLVREARKHEDADAALEHRQLFTASKRPSQLIEAQVQLHCGPSNTRGQQSTQYPAFFTAPVRGTVRDDKNQLEILVTSSSERKQSCFLSFSLSVSMTLHT